MKDFFRRYGWIYLPGILFLGLTSYIQVLVPRQLGQVVDLLNVPSGQIDSEQVWHGLLVLLWIALAAFFTRIAWRSLIMGNSRNMENWLRERLFGHLLKLPVEFYQQQKTGNLMAYAINDIGAIRLTFGPGLALAANAIIISAVSISSMTLDIDRRLTFFVLLPVPLILFLVLRLGREVQGRFRSVQETFSAVSDRVQESISGIQVIKAYGQEEEESLRFETLNRQSRDTQMRMTYVSAAMSPMINLLFGVSFAVGLIYGSHLVLDKIISLGEFVAFNGYLTLIVHPIQSVARIINLLQRGMASWKRYQGILNVKPAVEDSAGMIPEADLPVRAEGALSVDRLTFAFPGQTEPALRDISFTIRPGHRLGILGRTGSGKTALANLLSRLYLAPAGSICLDEHSLDEYPLQWLRRQIAVVPQDNFLFSASLLDNIRFFDPSVSLEQVQAAARLADLHETIISFPEGYETVIGERGVTLSGGQKQRVSLARALVRKAPLLVLDDALSAVDTETEQRILAALGDNMSGQACLIIANRVSALQDCDEILVLADGAVIDRGTHEQLIARPGLYAEIAAMQYDVANGGEAR